MIDWSLSQTYASPEGRIRWDRLGTGRPQVLLHGTPNYSVIWRRVAPRLAEQWSVYVFDWPGFGASDYGLHGRADRPRRPGHPP